MIYLCGDTHGINEISKITNKAFAGGLSADDFVIVLGDFGLFWSERIDEFMVRKNIERYLPATLLFIDGNHVYKHFRLPLLIRQRQPENMERSKNLPPFVGIVGIIIAVIFHADFNRLAPFFAPPCVGVAQGVHAAAVFLLVKMLALADFYHTR